MNRKKWLLLLECVVLLLLVGIAVHLLEERIASKSFPRGDEGSWMAVAAELSRGNGFTTRWLEHSFLKPYALPRPDDYRYPAFVCLLAAAFFLFGTNYAVAHALAAAIFIFFGLAAYTVIRRYFGRQTALATLPLIYFSLLQLLWASEVYTEGLFGIGVAVLILVSLKFNTTETAFWIWTGATIGLLYLIRPNAILFASGFFAAGCIALWTRRAPLRRITAGFLAMFAVMSPWLLRQYMEFGNPFHLAGSAGLLRADASEPLTYSIAEFSRRYGVLYFIKTPVVNIGNFFRILHEQEHGLEVIPLLFCIVGILQRKPFYNTLIAISFILTFFACCYTSAMGNWAGVRYFSSLIPFVYAYGINQIFRLTAQFTDRIMIKSGILIIIIGILLAPIIYPHRYYERFYATNPVMGGGGRNFTAYYAALNRRLANHPCYLAGSLAQLNFATENNCIGMQHFFNADDLRMALKSFKPDLIALTPGEMSDPYYVSLMASLTDTGFDLRKTPVDSTAVLIDILTAQAK
ncbi:MAG: glycosyltransferase family 39 protein [Chitinispirillaceae bacterium]|jgi:hypothetical protein|nr:glycosyltransferase family 39 protein [Chitinispirillaceae bacterium]